MLAPSFSDSDLCACHLLQLYNHLLSLATHLGFSSKALPGKLLSLSPCVSLFICFFLPHCRSYTPGSSHVEEQEGGICQGFQDVYNISSKASSSSSHPHLCCMMNSAIVALSSGDFFVSFLSHSSVMMMHANIFLPYGRQHLFLMGATIHMMMMCFSSTDYPTLLC